MSLKLKTYCPLIKVPFNLLVFVWMLHIYIYCSSMQISSAMLDESVGGQQLLSLPNISDWIQGWLYSCSSSKPPFYPFCCVLCVIVLMENQSSPCGSLANWSRFSKDPILVKISTAWYCEVYLVCATYSITPHSQDKELNFSLISPQIVPQKLSDVLKLQEWFNVGQKCLPSIHSHSHYLWSAVCVCWYPGCFYHFCQKDLQLFFWGL